MARCSCTIGFSITEETRPGVWTDSRIVRKSYKCELYNHSWQLKEYNKVNPDIVLSNRISILADMYAMRNIGFMKFVSYRGTNWSITDIEIRYPRLVLTVGGVYNGDDGLDTSM